MEMRAQILTRIFKRVSLSGVSLGSARKNNKFLHLWARKQEIGAMTLSTTLSEKLLTFNWLSVCYSFSDINTFYVFRTHDSETSATLHLYLFL